MSVIQEEIEDQPPVVEVIDHQVQDAANVTFQEGLFQKKRQQRNNGI